MLIAAEPPLPAAEQTNGGMVLKQDATRGIFSEFACFDKNEKKKGGETNMTTKSQLVGYVRKSKSGGALRMSIDAEAFAKAEKFACKDGRQFVSLIANAEKVNQILQGAREVTSLCQLFDSESQS